MISQTTEYALRAATALAQGRGTLRSGHALAAETRIPYGYLNKVIAPLVRARLVKASRGVGGGYRLERDPASVPLIEVLDAVDPPATATEAVEGPMSALHQRIQQATASFKAALEDCTLADLAAPPTPGPATVTPSAPPAD